MYAATPAEPTNDTASTPGWVSSASTESFAPCTTLNTPSGNPASVISSPRRTPDSGVRCDGFRMNAFPHARASGIIHIGTMFGKLNGVMPATTPTGKRMASSSMPPAIWSSEVPISSVGAPHARSTTSIPRRTSPRASGSVLPFSCVTSSDSSSKCSSSSAFSRKSTCARSGGGVSAHAGNASRAAATAWSISSPVECGRRAIVSPVAGSGMSSTCEPDDSRNAPPINAGTWFALMLASPLLSRRVRCPNISWSRDERPVPALPALRGPAPRAGGR